MVRDSITQKPDEWNEIIHAAEFEKYFTVRGTALKNVPNGYDKEHPPAEFLKFKSWYLEYPIRDEILYDTDLFLSQSAEIFKAMKPFNDFLNRALAGFEMPSRR